MILIYEKPKKTARARRISELWKVVTAAGVLVSTVGRKTVKICRFRPVFLF